MIAQHRASIGIWIVQTGKWPKCEWSRYAIAKKFDFLYQGYNMKKKNNELVTLIIYVFLELQSSNLYNKNQSNKEKKKSLTFGLGRRTGRIRAAMSPVLLAALGILLDPTKSTSCLILIPEFKGINTLASRYTLSIFTPYLSVVVKTTDCSIVKVNPRVMLLFFFCWY